MIQFWALLSLFFGTLLISGTSGFDDFADQTVEVTRETLNYRLMEIELRKEKLIKNLTEHGLDYFADLLTQNIPMAELYRNLSNFKPEEAKEWTYKLDEFGIDLDYPFTRYDELDEPLKGAALYLNAILNVTGKKLPPGETWIDEVGNVITLRNQYNRIMACLKVPSLEAVETDIELHNKLMVIQRSFRLGTLRLADFFVLEDRAVESIRLLKSTGSVETANKRQQLLERFLAINIRLGQTYHLDSHLRINQYFNIALEHYRQYTALKNAIDNNEK